MYKKTLALLSIALLSNYVNANDEINSLFQAWNSEEDLGMNGEHVIAGEDGSVGLTHVGEDDSNGGVDIPIMGGEDLPVIGGEEFPILGGEDPIGGNVPVDVGPIVGENGEDGVWPITGEDGVWPITGEDGVWPTPGADGGNDGLDDAGNAISSATDVLATSNSDDKACIDDDECVRNAQYCDGKCCFYKVCEGAQCGVSKIC